MHVEWSCGVDGARPQPLTILLLAALRPDWLLHGDLVRSCMCMCACGMIFVVVLCLAHCCLVFGGGKQRTLASRMVPVLRTWSAVDCDSCQLVLLGLRHLQSWLGSGELSTQNLFWRFQVFGHLT